MRAAGFTLIELMVALVVAAILASLALPAFFDAVRKSRRSEAFAALSTLQQAQERYRANNAAYAGTLAALGLPVAAESTQYTTANGHYQVSIATADASSYTLRAVAAGGQAQDKACATMMLRMRAGTVQYGSACSTCTLSEPPTDPGRCWSRQ